MSYPTYQFVIRDLWGNSEHTYSIATELDAHQVSGENSRVQDGVDDSVDRVGEDVLDDVGILE